jgi:hypothetical protein
MAESSVSCDGGPDKLWCAQWCGAGCRRAGLELLSSHKVDQVGEVPAEGSGIHQSAELEQNHGEQQENADTVRESEVGLVTVKPGAHEQESSVGLVMGST